MISTDQATESLRQSLANGDKAMSSKTWSGGDFKSEAVRRVLAVQNSQGELFDAAATVLDWLRELRPEDRPIAKFNRLEDALNSVREAHQMDPTA